MSHVVSINFNTPDVQPFICVSGLILIKYEHHDEIKYLKQEVKNAQYKQRCHPRIQRYHHPLPASRQTVLRLRDFKADKADIRGKIRHQRNNSLLCIYPP